MMRSEAMGRSTGRGEYEPTLGEWDRDSPTSNVRDYIVTSEHEHEKTRRGED